MFSVAKGDIESGSTYIEGEYFSQIILLTELQIVSVSLYQSIYFPFPICPGHGRRVRRGPDPKPAVIRQEAGYSVDTPPVHHWANIGTHDKSYAHRAAWN